MSAAIAPVMRSFPALETVGVAPVERSACRARRRVGWGCARRQLHPTRAHPPCLPARVANDERIRTHVLCDDGAGTDERVFTDSVAAHDGAVRAERRTPLHERRLILVFPGYMAAGSGDVREYHR